MSGLGAALSGLVGGYQQGRNVRQSWEDRESDNVRKKRRDELLDAQEKRAQESHVLGLSTGELRNQAMQRDLQKWDRQWTDDTRLRSAAEEADRAAQAGAGSRNSPLGAVPPTANAAQPLPVQQEQDGLILGAVPEQGAVSVSTKSPALPSGAVRAETAPGNAPFGAIDPTRPEPSRSAAGRAANDATGLGDSDDPLFAPAPDGKIYAARGPRTSEEQKAISSAAKSGQLVLTPDRAHQQALIDRTHIAPDTTFSFEDWQRMSRAQRQQSDLPVSELGGQGYFDRFSVGMGATPPNKGGRSEEATAQQWTDARRSAAPAVTGLERDARAAADAARSLGGKLTSTAALMGEQALNTGSDILDTVNAPLRAASQYATGKDPIGSAPRADLNNDGRNTSIISPALDALRPAVETPEAAAAALSKETGKKVTTAEAEVAQGAADVMDQIGEDPAMQAAANAMPVEALGAQRGQVMSPQRRAKAADVYLENYRKDGAPIYMRELLRQGKFEEAERFDTFIRSQESQAGMKKWGEGMFAAMTGDADGVFDFLADAYNEPGYYDDGYQLVKPESELLRDKSGNPVGIKLTLQHSATGEKITQTGQMNDIMTQFLWKLSPQEAFKSYNEQQAQLKRSLIEAEAKRDGRAAALIKDQLGWDNRAGLEMMKGSAGLDGKMSMTWPEAQAAAMGASPIEGLDNDEVSVAYRPQ